MPRHLWVQHRVPRCSSFQAQTWIGHVWITMGFHACCSQLLAAHAA